MNIPPRQATPASSTEAEIHSGLLSGSVSRESGSHANTVHGGPANWEQLSNCGICLFTKLSFTATNRRRKPASLSRAFYAVFRFPWRCVARRFRSGQRCTRSRDEWELRGVRRGALPLRPLLCYMWDRHRNWTGTGRVSRYELLTVSHLVGFGSLCLS